MNWFQWGALIVASSTVYVYVAFMALCTAKRMRDDARRGGYKLPRDLVAVCYALYITGVPADVIYNWTVGNWRFKAWRFNTPWKWTYTARVQWHLENPTRSTNYQAAELWGRILISGDPGHVTWPDPPPPEVRTVDFASGEDTLDRER